MARRKFDKKTAKTFSVVHRAHDDAKFFDDEASSHVLVEVPLKKKPYLPDGPLKTMAYTAEDVSKQLGDADIRENEGEAAKYGIYYDDSKYDYMQHLKPIGNSDGVFIAAKDDKEKKNNKKELDIEKLFGDQLPSKEKRKVSQNPYENIPKELQGLNPDMDPRLREVLEALEDEEYLEEAEAVDDDDLFNNLLQSGEVEDEDDFYYGSDADQYYDDEYDEWDMDNYQEEYDEKYDSDKYEEAENPYNEGEAPEDIVTNAKVNTNWEKSFNIFHQKTKNQDNEWDSDNEFDDDSEGQEEQEEGDDVLGSLPSIAHKRVSKTKLRKKKGAMTDTSAFSMSSSATYRTEGLALLDDRYEQLVRRMNKDDIIEENKEYQPFDMQNERSDFEGLVDDFLDNYELERGGRKLVKKNEELKRMQESADSVSKSKTAAARRKKKEAAANANDPMKSLGKSLGSLKF
ncbi:uncharacterized protein KQ657_002551 [Scheffersomyces spartinae]|uniref:Low temperature viability protein n=1 Tax=Scheffersomyces spartinae TaxID=45513 RepID=A0A9P7V6R6_9ASCO|nr:uncharacterized protein KQ657_002551 [Scheffersomyces spartinae]KAG7191945.1 hypothetical protein KQ657_002551 [Scheffersomyces spartinae]